MLDTYSFTALDKEDEKPARKANPAFNRLVHAYSYRGKLPQLHPDHEKELIILARDHECPQAMSDLIEHHMGFLLNIANRCAKFNNLEDHRDDLYNQAVEGFINSVKKFKSNRNARLATLAKHYVAAACYRYVMDMKHIFRIGTNLPGKKAFFQMSRLRNIFYEIYNRPMTNSMEDAKKGEMISGIPAKAIKNHMDIEAAAYSYSVDEIQIFDMHKGNRPESKALKESGESCVQKHILSVADSLIERDRDILLTILKDLDNKTEITHMVAEKYDISVERVRQIMRGALNQIRNSLADAGIKRISDVA